MRNSLTVKFLASAAALLTLISLGAHAANGIDVQILSATIKDKQIENATVILQKNGEQSSTAATNPQGKVSLNTTFADDSSVLLIV